MRRRLALLALLLSAVVGAQETSRPSSGSSDPERAARLAEYGRMIEVPTTGDDDKRDYITYKPVSEANAALLARFRALLLEEFSKYPLEFVRATRLKKLLLVEDLAVDGQRRAAAPAADVEILYYDVTYVRHELYMRHVVHHEYYHMIEEEWNGSFYYKDPKWAAFNDPSFTYGTGGKDAYGKGDVGSYIHPVKGFINLYSTYGLEEDKAEIWGVMFVPEEWKQIRPMTEVDPIIKAKVEYLRAFARSKVPSMDDAFWKKVSGEG